MGNMFSFGLRKNAKPISRVSWESRYEGALSVAVIGKVPVAGISGPWPDGNYALTWWSTHAEESAPSLEFHSSLTMARLRVEEMASRPSSLI